jgi:hypothetical protein
VSDISKKIFSIEPEADEDPIALVPEPVEGQDESVLDMIKPLLVRSTSERTSSAQRPIFELVEAIDDEDDDAAEEPEDTAQNIEDANDEDVTDVHLSDVETVEFSDAATNTDINDELPQEDETPLVDEDIITSRSADFLPDPIDTRALNHSPAPAPLIAPITPIQLGYVAPSAPAAANLRWVGPVLTVCTGLAIGALVFAYIMSTETISPIGLAGLIMAVIVPMVAVFALWATLRALATNRDETVRLAEVADRLTRADEAVTSDVARMSSAIRRELALVDSRLAQSRDELDTLTALISRQSIEMNGMTQRLSDRSETITNAMITQRDEFTGLSADFDQRMADLTLGIQTQRDALDISSDAAAKRVGDASEALDHATRLTAEHGDAIATAATTASASVAEAEARLGSLSDRIKAQAEELDAFYERRTSQLTELSEKLSNEKGLAETALYSQTEKLGAVDAQLEITESRLTDLINHAGDVQAQLTARLSDIDSTLSDADQRSRAFTADIADRVSDSVAQTRREISIMEGELRALQSRMDGAKSKALPMEPAATSIPAPKRVHLTPLDTDFPSLDQNDLSIPEAKDDDTLELSDTITEDHPDLSLSTMPPETDLIRRPGDDAGSSRVFGRGKPEKTEKNWRWRDMLGSIDPISNDDSVVSNTPPKPAPAVDRPGPGVPLTMPSSRGVQPSRAPQPEGSDVVARLCEVKLAPSAVVDAQTISDAVAARTNGGEAAQSDAVFSRLNSPVIHLRGVLSADLEFRLRAEGFRRSYNGYLNDMSDTSRLRSELTSANGRAYLLCAAALSAS